LACGGKRVSARRRFLSKSTVVAMRRAKAVPRPARSAALVTALVSNISEGEHHVFSSGRSGKRALYPHRS